MVGGSLSYSHSVSMGGGLTTGSEISHRVSRESRTEWLCVWWGGLIRQRTDTSPQYTSGDRIPQHGNNLGA